MIRRHGKRKQWRKKAVSAVIGNMIMVSITLALGFVFWTSVNSQAGATLTSYSEQTAADLNQLNEDFVISLIAFDYPVSGNVTIWFYNNGGLGTEINQIFFGNVSSSLANVAFSPSPLILAKQASGSVEFVYSTNVGDTYYVKVVAQYGSTSLSYEEK